MAALDKKGRIQGPKKGVTPGPRRIAKGQQPPPGGPGKKVTVARNYQDKKAKELRLSPYGYELMKKLTVKKPAPELKENQENSAEAV